MLFSLLNVHVTDPIRPEETQPEVGQLLSRSEPKCWWLSKHSHCISGDVQTQAAPLARLQCEEVRWNMSAYFITFRKTCAGASGSDTPWTEHTQHFGELQHRLHQLLVLATVTHFFHSGARQRKTLENKAPCRFFFRTTITVSFQKGSEFDLCNF